MYLYLMNIELPRSKDNLVESCGNLVEFEDGIMKILWWLFNI